MLLIELAYKAFTMVNSHTSQTASDAILTNLLAVDAALATQEAELTNQLQAVQEKLQSLKTVISLFNSNASASTADVLNSVAKTEAVATEAKAILAAANISTSEVASSNNSGSASAKPTTTKGRQPSKTPKKKPGRKPAQSKNWQDYLQDKFRQSSLPVAITTVLQQQPNQLLSVPNLIDAIFVAEIPQDVRNKARDRMLNILSSGTKDGQWYRGKKGLYSLSQSAATASR